MGLLPLICVSPAECYSFSFSCYQLILPCVILPGLQITAAVLALALTHVLQLTGMLQWWTRQTVEVENNMTSVERMVEYINLPQEPPR